MLLRHRRAQITARVSSDAPSPRVDSRAPLTTILRAMLATPRASVSPPRADAASRHRVSSSRRVVARDAAARAVAASADRLAPAAADLASRPDPRPDHARHRDAVLSQLPEGKLVYVPGGTAQTRNGVEGNARFRQEPDFLYLTGVEEPGYRALFGTGADAPFVLIAPRQPPEMDVWCGAQPSADELRRATGADIVYFEDEYDKALDAVCALEGQTIFVPSHDAASLPDDPEGLFLGLRAETTALEKVMARCRAIKSSEEIECLRLANRVSADAHVAMWRHAAARGGDVFEYELEAIFASETMRRGLRHLGYPSIVGAGRNGATLHYERNDARAKPEDLVLVDAGAEHRGYTADITRTFPAGGVFEARRKAVYEATLDVQNTAIEAMKPGVNWRAVSEAAKVQTVRRLVDLGLVRGRAEDATYAGVASLFLPHSLGHLLGLQVHDVGPGGPVPERLEVGHVVTCEPGIYFVDGLLGPAFEDPRLRDFLVRDRIEEFMEVGGVRIEDNIVITKDGHDNLTECCPKTVEDIEAIMRG